MDVHHFVLHALSPFKRKLTFPDGRTATRIQGGDVIFMKGQVHIGENIEETETDVVMAELKQSGR